MERTSLLLCCRPNGLALRGSAGEDAVDQVIDDLEIHSLAEPAVGRDLPLGTSENRYGPPGIEGSFRRRQATVS
jgi:hypothetical protein